MIRFITRVPVKSDCVKEYFAGVKPYIEKTRKEPGCIEYTVYWNEETKIATYFEVFVDDGACEVHVASEHFKAYFAAIAEKMQSSPTYGERFDNPIV